jgi:hypothetical protein
MRGQSQSPLRLGSAKSRDKVEMETGLEIHPNSTIEALDISTMIAIMTSASQMFIMDFIDKRKPNIHYGFPE